MKKVNVYVSNPAHGIGSQCNVLSIPSVFAPLLILPTCPPHAATSAAARPSHTAHTAHTPPPPPLPAAITLRRRTDPIRVVHSGPDLSRHVPFVSGGAGLVSVTSAVTVQTWSEATSALASGYRRYRACLPGRSLFWLRYTSFGIWSSKGIVFH